MNREWEVLIVLLVCLSEYEGPAGKQASLAVRRLLEAAVRQYWGIPLPEIAREGSGKPFFPSHPGMHFSLSHTKGYVLCAVSDRPVGADIQVIRPVSEALIRRVCTPAELGYFGFFDLWTLKESYIKLFGHLKGNLTDIEFSVKNGIITAPSEDVYSRVYTPKDGWRAAVCSLGDRSLPELSMV